MTPAHRQKLYRSRKILGTVAMRVDIDPVALTEAARRAGYVRADRELTADQLSDIAGKVLADWSRNVTT